MKRKHKKVSGVLTVEMAYLMPLILMLFILIIYTTFYFHDKTLLIGTASETAVAGAQMERWPGKDNRVDLKSLYHQRIRGKLIFFSGVDVNAIVSKDWVEVEARAERKGMKICVVQRAPILEPEKEIRRKRMIGNYLQEKEVTKE